MNSFYFIPTSIASFISRNNKLLSPESVLRNNLQIAATITIPFDVVKTHQQLELGESHLNPGNNQRLSRLSIPSSFPAEKKMKTKSTLEVMRHLIRTQGVRSLYTGLMPRLMKVAPACAIMIGTFEYSKLTIIRLANKLNEYESRENQKEGLNVERLATKGMPVIKSHEINTGVSDVL